MASKWFEGLSAQAQGFLIGSLLFRSKDYEPLLSLLDPEDAKVLKIRAAAILELERGQRVALLVAELKRLLMLSSQPWILAVDPSWIVHILANEKRELQIAALWALPKTLTKTLSSELKIGEDEIKKVPELKPPVASALRKAIERQLNPMRAVSFDSVMSVSHLLILTKGELEIVIAEMGKSGIAGAMAKVGLEKAAHMLEKASKIAQSTVIEDLKKVKALAWLDETKSEVYLKDVFEIEKGSKAYFSDCGIRILALVLSKSSKPLQREIAQRLDFEAGQKMLNYTTHPYESDARLDLEIFSRIIELAKERKIDERFGKCTLPQ